MRVRFLGAAQQWGDGCEFHGWVVLAPWHHGTSRWMPPRTDEQRNVVRRAMGMSDERSMYALRGPLGMEVG